MPPGTSDSYPYPPPAGTSLVFSLKGLGVSVQETHVVNSVGPIITEVTDQEVSHLFCGLW